MENQSTQCGERKVNKLNLNVLFFVTVKPTNLYWLSGFGYEHKYTKKFDIDIKHKMKMFEMNLIKMVLCSVLCFF